MCVAHATRHTDDRRGAWRAVAAAIQRANTARHPPATAGYHPPVPRLLPALLALADRAAAAGEEASPLPVLPTNPNPNSYPNPNPKPEPAPAP